MTDQSFTVWLLGRRYDVIRNGKEYIVKTGSDLVTDADEFNQVVGKIERMEQILGKNSHLIKPQ